MPDPGLSPTDSCPEPEDLLVVEDLATSYGSIEALHGVSLLRCPKGEVVAILGANGAGKSTLASHHLRPASTQGRLGHLSGCRYHPPCPGEDRRSRSLPGPRRPPAVPRPFGARQPGGGKLRATRLAGDLADDIAYVYELFPILGERRKQPAGTLSGGEQQMLAIGRALIGRPNLLLLDEPSMGLAPLVVERIFEALAKLNKEGLTMLDGRAERGDGALARSPGDRSPDRLRRRFPGRRTPSESDDRVQASYLGASRG